MLDEHASGADRSRPILARLLRQIRARETLAMVQMDRLTRSVSHLLVIIEALEATAVHFYSLGDPNVLYRQRCRQPAKLGYENSLSGSQTNLHYPRPVLPARPTGN